MKFPAAFLVLFSLTALAGSMSLEEAQKLSAQDGKPVLIDFYAVWCGPCKRFTADSKADADIKAILGDVHLVKLDAEKGGKPLAEKFTVRGYPTFVLVNKDLEPIRRWWGYSKDGFTKDMKAGLADPVTLDERVARFQKGENLQDAVVLAQALETSSKSLEALKYYEAADRLNTGDDANFYGFDAFRMKHSLFRGKKEGVSFSDLDHTARALLKSGKMTDKQPAYLGQIMFTEARSEKKMDAAGFYINSVLEHSEADDSRARIEFEALKLVYVDHDVPAALKRAQDFLGEGWEEDSEKLNEFSWWCFENSVNLKDARDLAAKAVSLQEPGPDRANILDTQAELENALGHPDRAVKLMEQAVNDDPRKAHKKQLERFRKLAEKDPGVSGN